MKRLVIVFAMLFSLLPIVHSEAASLSAVSVSPSSVAGGVASTGTVRLASVAPSGGHVISLSSSNTAAATVPSSVTIAAGKNTATFSIKTFPTTSNKITSIYATLGSVTKSVVLTVTPAKLSSLAISPTTIINERTGVATVKISGPAPTGGIEIGLSSNNAAASVPVSVSIPSGATSKTFSITAGTPSAKTSVAITATLGSASKTAAISVTPLLLSSYTIGSTIVGGKTLTGTVTLNGTAPTAGASVVLSSDNAAGTVPASVLVKSGASSATFNLITKQVTSPATVNVTATFNGISKSTATTVSVITITSMTLAPTSLTGGLSSTGSITISGPAPVGGAVIALTSANPDVISVPTSVSIAAGATTAAFKVNAAHVVALVQSSVLASYLGSTKTVALQVQPIKLASISLSPSSTVGGQSAVTGFVTLSGPAPAGGIVVPLTSNNETVIPYTQTTVQEGATMASFGMTTVTIESAISAVITAQYGGVTKSATLSVNPLAINSITVSPGFTGGNSTKWRVTMNGVAPAGGTIMTLTSSNPAVITLPATVTIPAGKNTIEMTIVPAVVSSDTNVTLTAKVGLVSKSATVTVKASRLYSIGLNSGITIGGLKATGTITLTGPAPTGGLAVSLSINSVLGQMPATVTVPAGSRTINFTINTTPTLTAKITTITGTAAGVSTITKLTINPPSLRDVLPSPISIVSGGTTPVTLRLTGPAPAGGMVVNLASSLIAYANVPATVTVPAGARSVQFLVTSTEGAPIGTTMTMTATLQGKSKSALIQITAVQLETFTVTPTSIVGGGTVSGKITISGAAPLNGASIALQTVDSSVEVPDTVTVIKNTTSVTFTIATLNVTTSKIVTIYATFNSNTVTVDLTLLPLKPSTLTIEPDSIEGTETATATLQMNGVVPANGAGVTVQLSSSDTDEATVPSTIVVPAGASSVTFPVTGVPVATAQTVTISATYNGTTVNNTLTINPPRISTLTLDDVEVVGSLTRIGTVTLTSAAPSGGWQVSLGSNSNKASVPATVTVPAGSTSATFTINTTAVPSQVSARLNASRSSQNAEADLTVLPPNLINFTLDKSIVLGGNANATGTVTIDVPAPTGGYAINLSSSNTGIATVPSTVTISSGQTSATFTVTSKLTPTTLSATITASKNAATFTRDLQVLTLTVTEISLTQLTVIGGVGTTATVTLNTGAPVGGATITLASGNAAATVPATLVFAAGSTSQTFAISTSAVQADTSATITASFGLTSASASLAIKAPRPTTLTIAPSSVVGSVNNATGTVTLDGIAPTGGAVVTLVKTGTGATVPANVSVAAGQTSATFTITSQLVSSDQNVDISATFAGTTKSASVTIQPLIVSSLTLSPTTVIGAVGNSTGTVTLNAAAPAGGVVVNLSSNLTSGATVGSTVTVLAGQSSATFQVTSVLVSAIKSPVITASFNGSSQTASLDVTPLTVSSVTLSPSAVLGGSVNSTGTVTINGAAPAGGVTVTLTSGNTSAATVPASVVIAQGATTATFTVTSLVVTSTTPVVITGSYNGSSANGTLTVNSFSVASLSLSPSTVVGGIANSTGTVTIGAPAPAGGLTVTLTSGTTSAATVPASVVVAQGQTSATFTVTSLNTSTTKTSVITAASGSSATATLTVNPITVSAVTVNPTSIVGGTGSVTATVTLNVAAPIGGVTVALSSSNPLAASMGANVVVTAGQTSANFTISTSSVSTVNTVIITAAYQGSKAATLTVNTTSINSLSISPSTVVGGVANATGTITLSQAAPGSGAVITLSSSNTSAVTVPVSITIPSGQTTGTFTATSLLVGSQATVTLTATYNGSKTGTITVNPIVLNSISIGPSSVYGLVANATGTVTLSSAAPTGGIAVSLSSSDTNAATVGSTVTVAAGQTTATFTITSKTVSAVSVVTITGSLNATRTATLTVNPLIINSVSVSPSSLIGGTVNATGTVTINSAAPTGGTVVSLSSNLGAASVPSTVTVAAGQTTATFTVTTTSVAAQGSATITATLNGSATASLTVAPPAFSSLSIANSSVTGGTSTSVTATISTAAPNGGLNISLSSSSGSAQVPAALTIAAGQTTGTATVTTSAVSSNTSVTITGSFNGTNLTPSFTINRPVLTDLSVNPQQFKGGNGATGTVTLSGPAPSGGMVVSLADNSSKLGTPGSVTVAAGNTTANFTLTSSDVNSNTWVTVSASLNGVTKTYDVKLKD